MDATDPQPDDPATHTQHSGADPAGAASVKRGLSRVLLALLAVVVIAAVAVGLSRCGSDDGPSGGEPEGAAQVVEVLAGG
ncbi:hypothetical protein [Blastococcus sp. SYSU D00820]